MENVRHWFIIYNLINQGMKKSVVAGLGLAAVAIAFAAKDPVIMSVNGEDVPKSEFEYLYNKNSQQQINPQTLDEYVEMFKLYKMKVADARAEHLDTLPAFLKEIEQYKHDLAAPYLADSVYLNKLVQEVYDRSKEEVEAYHIMLFKTRDPQQNNLLKNRADSLRAVLMTGAEFADLASRFSQDNGSNKKGGRMGWIPVSLYPYAFEEVAFTLPEGQISEVVESPVGYHILKGGKHRKANGRVKVAHILKMTQGMSPEKKAESKAFMDSLYNVAKSNSSTFGQLAGQYSDDKASARNNGELQWFTTAEMVNPFDSVAFSLKDGEISAPFETPYGYHIVKRLEHKDVPSVNEIKKGVLSKVSSPQDPRYKRVRQHQTEKFAKKHKASLNAKTLALMHRDLSRGALDSLYLANWTTMPNGEMPIASVNGRNVPAKDFAKTLSPVNEPDSAAAAKLLDDRLEGYYNFILTSAEEDDLVNKEPDYRNLLKEYVDGSLLYEVSVRKVWDKAAQDTEGLKAYFEKNRDNYKWTEPHVKGFMAQAVNDSVAELVRKRASELGKDSLVNTIRKEFPGVVGIDRVLVGKGTNAVVDYLMFGGPEVKPSNSKYTVSFMIDPRIITEPEEVNDVKGLVTSDYQNEFQALWEAELRRKYPVSVNEKVLKKVKSEIRR